MILRVVMDSGGDPFRIECAGALGALRFRHEADARFQVMQVSFTHEPDDVA